MLFVLIINWWNTYFIRNAIQKLTNRFWSLFFWQKSWFFHIKHLITNKWLNLNNPKHLNIKVQLYKAPPCLFQVFFLIRLSGINFFTVWPANAREIVHCVLIHLCTPPPLFGCHPVLPVMVWRSHFSRGASIHTTLPSILGHL